jgi:hypothetical protein
VTQLRDPDRDVTVNVDTSLGRYALRCVTRFGVRSPAARIVAGKFGFDQLLQRRDGAEMSRHRLHTPASRPRVSGVEHDVGGGKAGWWLC